MFEEIKNIIVEEFNIDEDIITPESEFANDLGLNSLELIELANICEEKFNVTFEEEDFHTFLTVSDVMNYIADKE